MSGIFGFRSGTTEFDKQVEIDVAILNESLFAEFLFETLPQLCLQCVNNELTHTWNAIGIFSATFSVAIALHGTHRYFYYMFIMKMGFHEVPAEVSLMGVGKVTLEFETEGTESCEVISRIKRCF